MVKTTQASDSTSPEDARRLDSGGSSRVPEKRLRIIPPPRALAGAVPESTDSLGRQRDVMNTPCAGVFPGDPELHRSLTRTSTQLPGAQSTCVCVCVMVLLHLIFISLFVGSIHITQSADRGQRTNIKGWFYPSSLWTPGTELRQASPQSYTSKQNKAKQKPFVVLGPQPVPHSWSLDAEI